MRETVIWNEDKMNKRRRRHIPSKLTVRIECDELQFIAQTFTFHHFVVAANHTFQQHQNMPAKPKNNKTQLTNSNRMKRMHLRGFGFFHQKICEKHFRFLLRCRTSSLTTYSLFSAASAVNKFCFDNCVTGPLLTYIKSSNLTFTL